MTDREPRRPDVHHIVVRHLERRPGGWKVYRETVVRNVPPRSEREG